jgi:phage-related protein
MKWSITFYNSKVEAQTMGFPTGILANFLHISEMIEELGPNIGKPYIGSLSSGLYEIRSKGKEGIGRSMYCQAKGREIVILHSFIKKSQKTLKKDLDLGRKRMKEVLK